MSIRWLPARADVLDASHKPAFDSSGRRLSFKRSLMAMLGMACAAMLVGLDQTIVGTALPRIVAELKGFDLYAWVATSYMLASVVTIPIVGRLGDTFGRKPFLLIAIGLFMVASALCGIASSMLFLVLARGLQGIGGGILIGTLFAAVADLFPDPRLRIRWLVFVSSAFVVTNAVGPTLGGLLTQYGGWRLVFVLNLPVGAISLLCVACFVPHLRPARSAARARLDWIGALLLTAAFCALHVLIDHAGQNGLSFVTLSLAVIALACLVSLCVWERRIRHPVLPLDMLLDARLAALFVMSLLGGFALFSLVFYVPLLFQGGLAMSPRSSGTLVTPLLLGTSAGSMLNNRIITRIPRANTVIHAGFAICSLASLSVLLLDGTEPHLVWMLCMGVCGLGLGIVGTSLTLCSQQIVGRDQLGAATALVQSLRTLGGMLGTMLTGALMGHLYTSAVYRSLDNWQATQWFKSFASPSVLVDHNEQAALIARIVSQGHSGNRMMHAAREALVSSIHVGLALAALAMLAGLCLAWFVPPVCVAHARDGESSA
ncbi:MFS transporter [Paraburkholderia sp. C35]|uniref:MFS transporter n=1 Tax=Paraburkholderia sp. C35 TaxID=2126993 RepID=UPI000D69C992|nr:MFS transporter [Paraburkholderia sp. C35]